MTSKNAFEVSDDFRCSWTIESSDLYILRKVVDDEKIRILLPLE